LTKGRPTFHPDRRAVTRRRDSSSKAIAIYKKHFKLDPTRLEVYEKLAELYHKQGLVNEARTRTSAGGLYYQKHGQRRLGHRHYQKMADLEPNNPSYHVKLAEIYQRQQLIEKAVSEYRVNRRDDAAHDRSRTRPGL